MQVEYRGIEAMRRGIDRVLGYDFKETLKQFERVYFRPVRIQRYKDIAKRTQYSPASLGTPKPVTRVIRGEANDPGFSVDSRALLMDAIGEGGRGVSLDKYTLSLFSEQKYANFQHELWKRKGPYDQGLFFAADPNLDKLETRMLDDTVDLFMEGAK